LKSEEEESLEWKTEKLEGNFPLGEEYDKANNSETKRV
jgi:hypothetical protein